MLRLPALLISKRQDLPSLHNFAGLMAIKLKSIDAVGLILRRIH